MSRTVCRAVCAAVAALVLICCTSGCGNHPADASAVPGGTLFDRGIMTMNNLVFETVNEYLGDELCSTFTVSGLRDKAVEKKINDRINAMYIDMLNGDYVPAYRGMALMLREFGNTEPSRSVNLYPEFNACNILSVWGTSWVSYRDGGGDMSFYYSYDKTLNFDLTTGDELSISDLFAPGVDGIETINGIIDRRLLSSSFDGGYAEHSDEEWIYEDNEILMAAPFTGIAPEQKFYIDANGDITLVMDEETPEFYTDFTPKRITVYSKYLAGTLGMSRSRPDGQPVFEDTAVVYNFASDYSDDYLTDMESESAQKKVRPNFYAFSDYKLPKSLPEPARAKTDKIMEDSAYDPIDVGAVYDRFYARYGDSGWSMSTSSRTTCENIRYDDAVCVRRVWEYDVKAGDEFADPETTEQHYYYMCYLIDSRSGDILEPETLFARPDKMREVLRGAIAAGLADAEDNSSVSSAEDTAAELTEHINGVILSGTGLILSYDIPQEELMEICVRNLGDPDKGYDYIYAAQYPTYDVVGCGNLAVFGDIKE